MAEQKSWGGFLPNTKQAATCPTCKKRENDYCSDAWHLSAHPVSAGREREPYRHWCVFYMDEDDHWRLGPQYGGPYTAEEVIEMATRGEQRWCFAIRRDDLTRSAIYGLSAKRGDPVLRGSEEPVVYVPAFERDAAEARAAEAERERDQARDDEEHARACMDLWEGELRYQAEIPDDDDPLEVEQIIERMVARLASLTTENKRLREALEWYAEETEHDDCCNDYGRRARSALALKHPQDEDA